MQLLTFLAGLQGSLWVGVAGETDDAQLRILGEKIVSPRHGNLRGNKVNLGGRKGGRRRERGREDERQYRGDDVAKGGIDL